MEQHLFCAQDRFPNISCQSCCSQFDMLIRPYITIFFLTMRQLLKRSTWEFLRVLWWAQYPWNIFLKFNIKYLRNRKYLEATCLHVKWQDVFVILLKHEKSPSWWWLFIVKNIDTSIIFPRLCACWFSRIMNSTKNYLLRFRLQTMLWKQNMIYCDQSKIWKYI